MKTKALFLLKWVGISAGALLMGAAAIVWFFPGPIVDIASRTLENRGIIAFKSDRISGNPAGGWTIHHPSVERPGLKATAEFVRFEIGWTDLVRRRFTIESLMVQKPVIDLDLAAMKGKKEEKETMEAEAKKWAFAADRILIQEGRISLENGPSWMPRRVDDLTFEAAYIDGGVQLDQFQMNVLESTVTASGELVLAPLKVDMELRADGSLNAQAKLRGGRKNMNASIDGGYKAASFRSDFYLRNGTAWKGMATFANVDLRRFRGDVPDFIHPFEGSLIAQGNEFQPKKMEARASFEVRMSTLASIRGEAAARKGNWKMAAKIKGPGIDANADGRWNVSDQRLNARWTMAAKKEPLRSWIKIGGLTLNASGGIKGRWPAPRWDMKAGFEDAVWNGTTVEKGKWTVSGTGFKPLQIKSEIGLYAIRMGSTTINRAEAAVKGTERRHQIQLAAEMKDYSVQAKGRGSLQSRVWTATWQEFQAFAIQVWKSTQPFVTTIGKNKVSVSGLRLAARESRLSFDGALRGKILDNVKADVRNFDLALLNDLKILPVPLKGRTDVQANFSGTMAKPSGTFLARIREFGAGGRDIGGLSGEGRIDLRSMRIDRMDIRNQAGYARLTAAIPIPFSRIDSRPLEATIKSSRFDLGILNELLPGVKFDSSNLEADLNVRKVKSQFTAKGALHLTAKKMRVPDQNLVLEDLNLQLAADGKNLSITRGTARPEKGGDLTFEGSVSTNELDLRLKARKFEFDFPIGLSGRANADLALAGSWKTPLLKGDIRVLTADFKPPHKKKKQQKESEPAEPRKKNPSPLAIDVRLQFDRDVWYKKDQTSIEARGDLTLRKDPYFPIIILGSVETIRGQYLFYGRSFVLEEGRVQFVGNPEPNPNLNIKAVHVSEVTRFKVFLTVTGTAKAPEIQLTSEPPLEETEIIEALVTGRLPSDPQEEREERDSTAAAKTFAANYLAGKLRQQLQGQLDLDVFQFKVTDEGETALVIGENITRDLFVSYSQTLGPEGEKRLRAEYILAKRWSLEGYTNSIGRYVIDLLFRFGFY